MAVVVSVEACADAAYFIGPCGEEDVGKLLEDGVERGILEGGGCGCLGEGDVGEVLVLDEAAESCGGGVGGGDLGGEEAGDGLDFAEPALVDVVLEVVGVDDLAVGFEVDAVVVEVALPGVLPGLAHVVVRVVAEHLQPVDAGDVANQRDEPRVVQLQDHPRVAPQQLLRGLDRIRHVVVEVRVVLQRRLELPQHRSAERERVRLHCGTAVDAAHQTLQLTPPRVQLRLHQAQVRLRAHAPQRVREVLDLRANHSLLALHSSPGLVARLAVLALLRSQASEVRWQHPRSVDQFQVLREYRPQQSLAHDVHSRVSPKHVMHVLVALYPAYFVLPFVDILCVRHSTMS